MIRFALLLLASLSLAACSGTEYIPHSHLKARTFNMNIKALQEPVSVRLRSDSLRRYVDYFSILGDSAMWIDEKTRQAVAVPLTDLQHFTVTDPLRGFWQGSLIGGGICLVGSSLLYALNQDNINPGVIPGLTLFGLYFGSITGGLIGVNVHFYIGTPPVR
jgi:hypothetical protein